MKIKKISQAFVLIAGITMVSYGAIRGGSGCRAWKSNKIMSGVCRNWIRKIRKRNHDQKKQPEYVDGYGQPPRCSPISIPNLFKKVKYIRGTQKTVCVPGLNCYSCPAATEHVPIGAFQAVVGSSRFKFSYYITGFFYFTRCNTWKIYMWFLCPFGWFQDLLHKIPGKKFSTARLKPLRYLKYIILIVFVILLPMLITNSIGMGDPFFCKYICPQGVFRRAIPLSLGNAAIRSALGTLFSFKCLILITVVVLSIFVLQTLL